MSNKTKRLRCFVKSVDQKQYVAVCVDLNLAVQADSFEGAISKLESVMHSYIVDLCGVDRKYAKQLLDRKAPLSFFAEYYFIKIVNRIFSLLQVQSCKTFVEDLNTLKAA